MKTSPNALSRKCRRSLEKWPSQVWQRFEVSVPKHAQLDYLSDSKARQLFGKAVLISPLENDQADELFEKGGKRLGFKL